jgi:hypothetical protein
MTQTADCQFFQKVLPICNVAARQAIVVHSPTQRVGGVSDPARRMRPVRGEPAMVMSDRPARLSGRKRGCRSLERSVVGDL